MTEEKTFPVLYLDREDYRLIHALLSAWTANGGEPIPSFDRAKQDEIDGLINIPQRSFFGREVYPTLSEKAAIIFYTINKQQIFVNGNKRMSALSLFVFLGINGKTLDVSPDELKIKTLWLANTASLDFPQVKADLVQWIEEHLM